MSGAGLDEMIALVLQALTPGLPQRQQARAHPYTADGRQVDVLLDDRWVEVGERGLAHRPVLAAAGLADRGGLALSMGLDRLLMLVKGIPDIRLLRSGDPRIADQMRDLTGHQRVNPGARSPPASGENIRTGTYHLLVIAAPPEPGPGSFRSVSAGPRVPAEKGGAEHVREVYRPGAAGCGPGSGRGQDAQSRLHRD